jgi:hypothetical protein
VTSPKIFDTVTPPDHSRVGGSLPALRIDYCKCLALQGLQLCLFRG